MTTRSVTMREIQVSVDDVKRLSDEERFTYYLLGHMFNELLCLQKLVAFAMPKHDDMRPARIQPEMGQSLLMFRLACGKVWEAQETINSVQISATLRQRVFPSMASGMERLKAFNKAIAGATWLSPMRNGMGFHFPSFKDWQPLIQPDDSWVPDSVFVGEMTGNTFYAGSDAIAQAWMFGLHGAPGAEAVAQMIEQMIALLRLTNSFLEDVIGTLVSSVVLGDKVALPVVGEVPAPEFQKVEIPFWTAMPSSS